MAGTRALDRQVAVVAGPTPGGLRDAQRRHAEWLERLSTRAKQYVGPG